MNEKLYNIGYSTYLQEEPKSRKKWTSNIVNLIDKHKILSICLLIVSMCVGMNFWLICNFVKIIERNNIF